VLCGGRHGFKSSFLEFYARQVVQQNNTGGMNEAGIFGFLPPTHHEWLQRSWSRREIEQGSSQKLLAFLDGGRRSFCVACVGPITKYMFFI
jgi:hypothetical protein